MIKIIFIILFILNSGFANLGDKALGTFNLGETKNAILTIESIYDTVSPGVGAHGYNLNDTITLSFKPKENCVFIKWTSSTNNISIVDQFNPNTQAILNGDGTIVAVSMYIGEFYWRSFQRPYIFYRNAYQ
jgi:hypothetical protein